MLNRLKTVFRDIRVNRDGRRANHQVESAPLIFRRGRGATITQHYQWHRRVFLRLEINQPSVMLATSTRRPPQHSTLTVLQPVRRRDEIIERVVRRQTRIESRTLSSMAPTPRQAQAGVSPSPMTPPMVLRQPPVTAVEAAAPPVTFAADLSKMPPRPAKHEIETIDINRLTDQVVTALDRRMSAWRERTGRL